MDDALLTRLRQVIGESGLTHKDFAARVGIDAPKLSKVLHGRRRISAPELGEMADAGGVSAQWLLHGTAPRSSSRPPEPVGLRLTEESRRRRFLEAAARLIADRGYHRVRVGDIAAACGTSTAAVHYHFPGKHDVLNAALRYCVEQAFERQAEELALATSATDAIHRLIELQLPTPGQVRREWSVWLQFWTETVLQPELRELHSVFYAEWRAAVVRAVEQGQREGAFREVDIAAFALQFTAMTDGLAVQVLTGVPDVDIDLMRTALRGFVAHELLVRDPAH